MSNMVRKIVFGFFFCVEMTTNKLEIESNI